MKPFPLNLDKRLEKRKVDSSLRSLGETSSLIDFSSNDYLGFSSSPSIFDHTQRILAEHDLEKNGATGSRLLSGNHGLFAVTEEFLSRFHQTESALIFNSGYDANIGFFSTVPKKEDVIVFDEFIHASIRDGISMGVAKSFKYKHNNMADLQARLENIATKVNGETYIVTESVFSMDGDMPHLKELVLIAERYNSLLVIDEAHAVGVFGEKGKGMVQQLDLQNEIFARIITFGKALGGHGAAVLGSNQLKDYLLNFARSFIYTTALPPHSVATILAAYQQFEEITKENSGTNNASGRSASTSPGIQEIKKLKSNVLYFKGEVERKGLKANFITNDSPIQSCVIPGNQRVRSIAAELATKGFSVKPILSPTVPKGKERLRFCLHSFNSFEEISDVLNLLVKFTASSYERIPE